MYKDSNISIILIFLKEVSAPAASFLLRIVKMIKVLYEQQAYAAFSHGVRSLCFKFI